jgi:hypothetical protein
VGLLVDDTVHRRAWRKPAAWVAGALVGVLALFLSIGVVEDLSTKDRTDYRALGEFIETEHPETIDVIFDTVAYPLGRSRPGFAGYGRYTATDRQMIRAAAIHTHPEMIVDGQDYLIATSGPVLHVAGWEPIVVSGNLTRYIPDQDPGTVAGVAAALIEFGRATESSKGGVFRIAGALVLAGDGELGASCAEIDALIADDPAINANVVIMVNRSPLGEVFASCPAGDPLS